jgi:hypothetical protein
MKTEHIITDPQAISTATRLPLSMVQTLYKDGLKPIGYSKFKGDTFTGPMANLSVNDQFDKGTEYPVYDSDGMDVVIGKSGKSYKMTQTAWTKVKYL